MTKPSILKRSAVKDYLGMLFLGGLGSLFFFGLISLISGVQEGISAGIAFMLISLFLVVLGFLVEEVLKRKWKLNRLQSGRYQSLQNEAYRISDDLFYETFRESFYIQLHLEDDKSHLLRIHCFYQVPEGDRIPIELKEVPEVKRLKPGPGFLDMNLGPELVDFDDVIRRILWILRLRHVKGLSKDQWKMQVGDALHKEYQKELKSRTRTFKIGPLKIAYLKPPRTSE